MRFRGPSTFSRDVPPALQKALQPRRVFELNDASITGLTYFKQAVLAKDVTNYVQRRAEPVVYRQSLPAAT